MQIVTSVKQMQRLAAKWRRGGSGRTAFVPTMGYLHAGHMSLVRRARSLAGAKGRVVASIFVNPTQFAPGEDLSKYPRDLARDKQLCGEAGVDVLFFPSVAEMYPGKEAGAHSTYVVEESLAKGMEGASRPTHFRGVATVVAKLFNLVQPDAAVFGEKDFQQAAVIQRMTRDLNFPTRIVVAPTAREKDGLAMSSRNKYLSAAERAQAVVLSKALKAARRAVSQSARGVSSAALRAMVARMVREQPSARLDYVECFDPRTLAPLKIAGKGGRMALAVWVGQTRLIDNGPL